MVWQTGQLHFKFVDVVTCSLCLVILPKTPRTHYVEKRADNNTIPSSSLSIKPKYQAQMLMVHSLRERYRRRFANRWANSSSQSQNSSRCRYPIAFVAICMLRIVAFALSEGRFFEALSAGVFVISMIADVCHFL